jgi:hypothetical protein
MTMISALASSTMTFGLAVAGTPLQDPAFSWRPKKARAYFELPKSDWIDTQLDHVRQLDRDWDGYNADPITAGTCNQMATILRSIWPRLVKPGSIVPGADGSLQAEWHVKEASIGLLVESDGAVVAWIRPVGGEEIARSGGVNASHLMSAVAGQFRLNV